MTTPPRGHSRRFAPNPGESRPRIDFDLDEFERQIQTHGYRTLWEQAAVCACRNFDSNQPKPDCPICNGKGWEYHSEQEIPSIVDSLSLKPEGWIAFGEYVSGMATFTVKALHAPGRWHRYTLLDSVMEHSEICRRRPGAVTALSYPVAEISQSEIIDGALCSVTRGVLRLRLVDPSTNLPGAMLYQGQDFNLTAAGLIDWSAGDALGTAPAPGAAFSVSYLYHPRYVVTEHPHVIRDTNSALQRATPIHERMPVQVMARLDWMAREQGK